MTIDSSVLKNRTNLHTHLCDLPKISGSNLPKLLPNAKFYSRWKRNFQKLVLVSARHPSTRLILRSHAAVAFEKRKHSRSPYRWIIHPCSMLRFYWDTMMTVVFLYIFVTVPYIMCFHRIGRNSGSESWYIMYPAYAVCIVDICLNFITGFVSSDGHEIFLDAALVMRNYAKGYFFIDLVSSIPYTWFYPTHISSPGPDSNSVMLIVELLPILKIIRILTVRRNIHQINRMCEIPQIQETTMWLVILTLLIFHWSSCVSYVFPYIVMHIRGKSMENSGTYYMSMQLRDKPDWKIYLVYVHIGVSNLISSNFIEFENFGTLDRTIRCILLLLGKSYTIYLIVTILQLMESSAEPELKYQRIMHQVKEYIRMKKLPRYLQNKLISYYEYRYEGSFFKENVISDTLSAHLNQEILFHSSRGLLDIAIVRNLSRNVLVELMSILKPVIYLEEDIIYKVGAKSDCMYFIASGTVALITFSGKEVCHLTDGNHFGEIGLFHPNQRRTESVIALEVCELLCLDRRDFKCLFSAKSDFYDSLERIARERFEKVKEFDEQNFNETI